MMALFAVITLATASLAVAQQPPKVRLPQASPSATVSQTIGITDIAITYHRPSVRGRTLWGDIPSEKVAALIKANSVAPAAEGEGTVDGAARWRQRLSHGAEWPRLARRRKRSD
jgi:hypothetical protein